MNIGTSYKTHSGRHSGSIEGQRTGMQDKEIQRTGRWVKGNNSKMHQFYLSNLPIPFARGIAGFKDRPFHLRRNEAVPPIGLQQTIFPFIERVYDGQGEQARQCWEREC
ncbi:hypothetical protein B0O80DRAFT_447628 [Mortierella sp. GBAus27b]|nr:hypothetical protein B0O80DRAFT_447628 [Mortierella sp. GBAus27b]